MKDAAAAALLWLLVVLSSGQSSADVPDITQQSFIDRCIKEHNRARSSVQPAARGMQEVVGRTVVTLATADITSVAVKWRFPSQLEACWLLLGKQK